MKMVYVAGAMSSDNLPTMLQNIRRGVKMGAKCLEAGFAPFVPHLDIFFQLMEGEELKAEKQDFYDYSMEILTRCNYVVVCEKSENSYGTKKEIEKANELGIPVFNSFEEMLEHSKLGEY